MKYASFGKTGLTVSQVALGTGNFGTGWGYGADPAARVLDLWPMLLLMRQWGERWSGPWGTGGTPLKLLHRGHDHELHAVLTCAGSGEPVDARSAQAAPSPYALRRRAAFAAAVAGSTTRKSM